MYESVHTGLWIRSQEGKIERKKQKNARKLGSNYWYLIKNVQVNLEQLHVFIFIFEPSFESFSTPENSS